MVKGHLEVKGSLSSFELIIWQTLDEVLVLSCAYCRTRLIKDSDERTREPAWRMVVIRLYCCKALHCVRTLLYCPAGRFIESAEIGLARCPDGSIEDRSSTT